MMLTQLGGSLQVACSGELGSFSVRCDVDERGIRRIIGKRKWDVNHYWFIIDDFMEAKGIVLDELEMQLEVHTKGVLLIAQFNFTATY